MTTFTYRSIVALTLALPLSLTGCGADEPVGNTAPTETSLRDVARVLSPGDEGADVLAVYGYLRDFGYFPNPELSERYPHWTPVVDRLPENPEHFGPELESAVRAFQSNSGLEPTGVVDTATLGQMLEERCANPDNEFASPGEQGMVDKWNHSTGTDALLFPAGSAITWFRKSCTGAGNTPCPSYASGGSEIVAFSLWAGETNRSFTRLTSCGSSCTPNIDIRYYDNSSIPDSSWIEFPAGAIGAGWKTSATTAKLAINTAIPWESQSGRLARLINHEVGHILGLAHSSIGPLASGSNPTTSVLVNSSTNAEERSVMWYTVPVNPGPVCPSSGSCWHLTLDDRQGIISRCDTSVHPPTNCYSSWTGLPGFATDIAVGGTSPVGPITWVTSGSNTVWKRGLNTFVQDPNVTGIAIAVTSGGVPWVVTSSNVVSRRSNATCNLNAQGQCAGSWATIPGDSARDIAIGGSMDSTWIVTNVASGGNFVVRAWNGSSFFLPGNSINAQRITVDNKGFPWVVKADGTIWTSAATNGSAAWTQVTPGGPCAKDIGAGRNGGVYIIGCTPNGSDFDIWSFNKQTKSQVGTDVTVTTWRELSGFAKRIAVGPDARPYVVQSAGWIFNLEGI